MPAFFLGLIDKSSLLQITEANQTVEVFFDVELGFGAPVPDDGVVVSRSLPLELFTINFAFALLIGKACFGLPGRCLQTN